VVGDGSRCIYRALLSSMNRMIRAERRRTPSNRLALCWTEPTVLNGLTKGKGSPYSTAERRVPELIPVLGSQPEGDVSHKPGGRLPLLSARPAVTPATLMRAATSFAAR